MSNRLQCVSSQIKTVNSSDRTGKKSTIMRTDISPLSPLIDKEKKADSFVDTQVAKQIGYVPNDDGDNESKGEEGRNLGADVTNQDQSRVKKRKIGIGGGLVRGRDVKIGEQAWKEAFESINSTSLRNMLIGFEQVGSAVENFLEIIGLGVVVKKVRDDIRVTARAVNDVNRKVLRTSRAASRNAKELGNSISSLPDDISKLASMDRAEAFSLVRIGVNPLKKPKMIGGLENKRIKDKVKTQKRKKTPNALNLAARVQSLPRRLQYDYKRKVQREALRGESVYVNSNRQLSSGNDTMSVEKMTPLPKVLAKVAQREFFALDQVRNDDENQIVSGSMMPVFALDGGGVNMSAVLLPYTEPYDKESLLGLVAPQSVAKAMTNLNYMDEEEDVANGSKIDRDMVDEKVLDKRLSVNDDFEEEYVHVSTVICDVEDVVSVETFKHNNEVSATEIMANTHDAENAQFDYEDIDSTDSFGKDGEVVDMDNMYPDMDAYEILGVDFDADIQTIKKAYRKAIFKWHPDRFPDDTKKQLEGGLRLEVINRAWYCLNDEDRRTRYDEYGGKGVGTSAAMEADIIESFAIEKSDFLLEIFKILISSLDVTFFLLESLWKATVPIVTDGGKIAKERIRNAFDAKGGIRWKRLSYLTKGTEK